jgi:menaquinone-dependent protoporphyrinogen oxidase
MKVLVAFATRHEATAEIAERIGDVLRDTLTAAEHSAVVDVRDVHKVGDVDDYEAVLVGSAIYLGRWLEAAWRFLRDNQEALLARPVWLFASGPVGEPLLPRDEPPEVDELVAMVGARTHKLFAGALRPAELGATERALIHESHTAEGDFRDWDQIAHWAGDVAEELLEVLAGTG